MKYLSLFLGVGMLVFAAWVGRSLHLGGQIQWIHVASLAVGGLGWLVACACLVLGEGGSNHLRDTTFDKLIGNSMFAPLSAKRKARLRLF